jgi:hypothetical protein
MPARTTSTRQNERNAVAIATLVLFQGDSAEPTDVGYRHNPGIVRGPFFGRVCSGRRSAKPIIGIAIKARCILPGGVGVRRHSERALMCPSLEALPVRLSPWLARQKHPAVRQGACRGQPKRRLASLRVYLLEASSGDFHAYCFSGSYCFSRMNRAGMIPLRK